MMQDNKKIDNTIGMSIQLISGSEKYKKTLFMDK